jgi:signal transduction histidine kinase
MTSAEPAQGSSGLEASATGVEAASSLLAHIQGLMEHQKALLARELHDELGGLLVGAVMDIAWAEQHLAADPAELKQKLLRARQTLSAAIDLKRKLIEDLRPTLLDNVGLFAALRWHAQAACKRAGIECTIHLPEEERRFLPNIPIAIFRIFQEALAMIVSRRPVATADFNVFLEPRHLVLDIHTRSTVAATSEPVMGTGADAHYLAAIQQRVAALGGDFQYAYEPATGTRITARFPLEHTVMPG